MTKKGIIGAGNWLVDTVKTLDRFPKEGELCNIKSIEIGGGGGPCNVLFDLAAMTNEIPLYAAGVIGNDANGDYLMNEIAKRNIDSRFMFRSDVPTSFTDVMSADGKRTFFHCRGANAELGYEHLSQIDVDAKIFYLAYLLLLDKLDGTDPEYGTPAARILKEIQSKGILTLVDFVSERKEVFKRVTHAALPYIDVLAINEIEAGNTFDLEIRREDDSLDFDNMKKALHNFMDAGVANCTIFHMPECAAAIDKDHKLYIAPSFKINRSDIVGSNGAGDAFCAGVLYGIHENMPLDEILKLGAASSFFNLKSATASGGAVSIEQIKQQVNKGPYREVPQEF